MNSFTVLWETALKKLEKSFSLNNNYVGFNTYIKMLAPEFEDGGKYFFKVGNVFYKEQLEERFLPQIKKVLEECHYEAYGKTADITPKFLVSAELDEYLSSRPKEEAQIENIFLDPSYTFDSFVVGKSNNLAHAASMAVANAPGLSYNPLFIYGGVGLGKTHLMQAIGNRILQNNKNAKIIYITTEAFINEYVNAVQKRSMEDFRNKFRKVDVLMIDDIQFISRAKETQEELFHTFNTLRDGNRQIIFSSDKPPVDIPGLEERLLSRFQWGLLADIGLPDYETRVAILKNKAPYIKEITRCSLNIDDEVFHAIASKEDTNIRDLEGALKRVIAMAHLDSALNSISLPMAESALKSFFVVNAPKAVTPRHVVKTVCDYYGVTEEDILSKKKNREIAFPRQVGMYLLKELTDLTSQKICDYVGLTNHSTVIYACKKIAEQIKKDSDLQRQLGDITQRVRE